MPEERNSINRMPGLPVVRQALGLKQKHVAEFAKVTPVTAYHWETGKRGVSIERLQALASELACRTDDLVRVPSEGRLDEIRAAYHRLRAAYHRREAERAEEAAREVRGVA